MQNYRKAVISGFSDVENALDGIRQTALRERLQREVVTSSRRAFDISEQRLRAGHRRSGHRAADPADPVPGRGRAGAGAARTCCRRSSVFIKRSAAVGCRSRWKPPMHGELPKQIWAKTSTRNRRVTIVLHRHRARRRAVSMSFSGSPPRGSRSRFGAENGPVPVLVTAAAKADVPVYLDAVGTIKALNTVTVSPQVDGKLLSVGFKEGDDVKKGDVLAQIDPTTYQAQLDQAIAKKAQDEAQLANAKIDLDRYEKLAATNAINRQQADTQKALVAQDAALVQSDQARDRERAGDARLHHHRRADRRPHRHPHGRRRQYRACLRRRLRDRGDHRDQTDLGAVQSAAAGYRPSQHALSPRDRSRSRRSSPTATRCSTAAPCAWWTTRSTRPPAP